MFVDQEEVRGHAVSPSDAEDGWAWKRVGSSELLARAFHSANLVGGKLLVFGGTRSADPRDPPLGDLLVLEPLGLAVERVVSGGPARSHHAAVTLHDRWLVVVGGWDGKRRLADVHSFDLAPGGGWRELSQAVGNQAPVGLSGHTCTKLSDHEVLVLGREGGVHTQRRFASIFSLHINTYSHTYWYKECESRTASRSGHTAILTQAHGHRATQYQLLVFGGRNSAEMEPVEIWTEGGVRPEHVHAPGLVEHLRSLISSGTATSRRPGALRHHSMTLVGPFAVLYGGECFSKTTDAVCNDLFIYDTRSPGATWYHISNRDPQMKRFGHRVVLTANRLCLIGGRGQDGRSCSSHIYTLGPKS
ncbi:kelch domain-containing protein 9-like [Stegostoma tigrinum]|uniref:kelch domain-containing protein 9-like n=1 Tax=Stegostoma tigrinum TaxID=3053191 RepID=UPI0028701087|nr:kelch domain-containing protein 9-like [Stegostoma tigrinum]